MTVKWDNTIPREQLADEWAQLVIDDINARIKAGALPEGGRLTTSG